MYVLFLLTKIVLFSFYLLINKLTTLQKAGKNIQNILMIHRKYNYQVLQFTRKIIIIV
jgi:hypothetical protein